MDTGLWSELLWKEAQARNKENKKGEANKELLESHVSVNAFKRLRS
jgi:hypothetical protein